MEDRDAPALIWSIAPNAGDATQFMRFVPAYVMRMLQAHRGTQWHAKQILSTLPPPRSPKLYASQLGCPLIFNAQINAIEIERRDLYAVERSIDRHVYAQLATYAEYLLAQAPGPGSIRDAVASAIRDGLTQSRHDFDLVVQRLGMSPRALQRRIAASETTFSRIRDEIRCELAASMVADSDLSRDRVSAGLFGNCLLYACVQQAVREKLPAHPACQACSPHGRSFAIKRHLVGGKERPGAVAISGIFDG